MNILALDPGCTQSASLCWDGRTVSEASICQNADMLLYLRSFTLAASEELHVEMISSYGMPVGREVFDTCLWIGRFIEAWEMATKRQATLVYRQQIKLHHCHSARAKDANVRRALIDKYGKPGTKKEQGVTYKLKSHLWAAFALATYAVEAKK